MEVTLDKVQSHWIDTGHRREVEKEELFPYFDVTVRGQQRRVCVNVNRYRHSSGMSEWRMYVTDIRPDDGIGPATKRQINDAVSPIVEAWLDSDEYVASRQRAFASMVARAIRDASTTADYKAREALANFGDELTDADRERLQRAYDLRMESLRLLTSEAVVA